VGFFNGVLYCVIVWFASMMRYTWFDMVVLLFLMTSKCSLHFVENIPPVCPVYSLGYFSHISWYLMLIKYLLCVRFICINSPIIMLVTKVALRLYS
jgi:hypothetical protein